MTITNIDNLLTDDAILAELGARIAARRVDLQLTQAAVAEEAGMSPVFETARMYKGKTPALPLVRMFGITTFELG